MSCRTCKGGRIASISSKSSDLNFTRVGDAESDGYVPSDMGIGGGDYVEITWCLDCGTIQGQLFPLPPCQLETGANEDGECTGCAELVGDCKCKAKS